MSQQFGELAECYWDDAVAGHLGDGPRELARCRNDKSQPWELGRFMGYVWEKDQSFRLILHGESTRSMVVRKFCQIYRAPPPGIGYRAIDPRVDRPESDDDLWIAEENRWESRFMDSTIKSNCDKNPDQYVFSTSNFYRRKIKPTAKFVPYNWENREKLFGLRILLTYADGSERDFVANDFRLMRNGDLAVNGTLASELLECAKFFGTNNPVGMISWCGDASNVAKTDGVK